MKNNAGPTDAVSYSRLAGGHRRWWSPLGAIPVVLAGICLALAGLGALVQAAEGEAAAKAGGNEPLVEGAAVAPSKDYRGGQVKLQLMSEVKRIQAGQPFTVGLWIRHAPGWHTYWSNPGVVGVPTTFVWDLPEGFSAGPVQWPAPQRTKMATLTAYGYEEECVLLIDITPPADLSAGEGPVTLKTKVGWMACASSCHPGWSDFELKLPLAGANGKPTDDGKASAPAWNKAAHQLFEAERGRFPEVIEGWSFAAQRLARSEEAEGEWMELTLRPSSSSSTGKGGARSLADWGDVYFFSIDDQVDSDTPQELRANADGSLTLRMKRSQYSPKDPQSLSGVAFRADGWKAEAGGHPWMWLEAAW